MGVVNSTWRGGFSHPVALSMGLVILILLVLLLCGAFPTGGYGAGYGAHGIIGTVLVIVLILLLLGRL